MLDLTECYTPKDPHMYVLLVNGEIVRGKKKNLREKIAEEKNVGTHRLEQERHYPYQK